MNEQRLVTLTGPRQDQLMEMARSNREFKKLSDIEAGLLAIQGLGEFFPELTWNDFRPEFWQLTKELINKEARQMPGRYQMSGCAGCEMSGKCRVYTPWNCVANLASDVKDAAVDLANWTGDKLGDAVRLITDEEVIDGASRLAQAYITSGGSEGIKSLQDALGEGSGLDVFASVLSNVGEKSKKDIDAAGFGGNIIKGVKNEWLIAGGIGFVALLLLVTAATRR